ncbi:putative phospholipase carboxylesterase [Rosellinia necatrix]|uniref:Putative phospholipase carboxylesterase n=1 Tax=Rosellinia necatrix TaxID=77044 RepID=A0A1W2TKA8_ROSNE|nr:putative phospholipase carboxylesterase [Rosellinia necatrix]
MDSLQRALSDVVQTLSRRENHRVVYITTTATTAAAALALLAYSRHCYAEWHALGESGVPRTVGGWLINVAAHALARRDHRAVPAPYEREKQQQRGDDSRQRGGKGKGKGKGKEGTVTTTTVIALSPRDKERYGEHSRTSFFPAEILVTRKHGDGADLLPARGAPRPTVPTTVVPQRQTTETAASATVARQDAYIAALAAANGRLLAVRPSALESPNFGALWLLGPEARRQQRRRGRDERGAESSGGVKEAEGDDDDDDEEEGEEEEEVRAVDPARAGWLPRRALGEVAHVHAEGSAHVCLSLVDAAAVVRRGWGERHKLSGVAGVLPWGYVLLYAPRDGEPRDWDVWKGIVLAGARAVARSAGFEGEVVAPDSPE